MLEHRLALIARHPRHRFGGVHRGGNAGVDGGGIGLGDPERDLAGIFVGHLEVGIGLLRLVGEIERIDVLELHHFPFPVDQKTALRPPLVREQGRGTIRAPR
jgi:hypothetical protein